VGDLEREGGDLETAEEVGDGCRGPERFTVGFFCDICDSCGDYLRTLSSTLQRWNVSIWLG
jgi:hypothetical protein